jgi:LysM repeat protein
VKSGETVSSIARKYHVSAQKIISVNNLNKNGLIRTGQRLRIPN